MGIARPATAALDAGSTGGRQADVEGPGCAMHHSRDNSGRQGSADIVMIDHIAVSETEAIWHIVIQAGDGTARRAWLRLRNTGHESADCVARVETEIARLHNNNNFVERGSVTATRFGRTDNAGDKPSVNTSGSISAWNIRLESRRRAVPDHVDSAIM